MEVDLELMKTFLHVVNYLQIISGGSTKLKLIRQLGEVYNMPARCVELCGFIVVDECGTNAGNVNIRHIRTAFSLHTT